MKASVKGKFAWENNSITFGDLEIWRFEGGEKKGKGGNFIQGRYSKANNKR